MPYSAGSLVKTTTAVNQRGDASIAPDNVIQGIPAGTVLGVIGDSKNGFANVTYQGADGWVSEQFLVSAAGQDVASKTITPGGYRITGSGVNIRSGPSLNDGILVTTGPVGETFVATGPAQNGYAAGTYTSGGTAYRGWIAEQYLGFGQPVGTTLPVLAPAQPPPVAVQTQPVVAKPPAPQQSGMVLAGGLLALALVIYFMAK